MRYYSRPEIESDVHFEKIYDNVDLIVGRNSTSNGALRIFGPSYMYRYQVRIGSHTHIGRNVEIIIAKRHTPELITNDIDVLIESRENKRMYYDHYVESYGDVSIGNDVWIGNDVTIIGGIKIGNGAIVGAKALVNKDVAPYSIVGGVPIKFIKNRFTESQIKSLEKIAFWNWDKDLIRANINLFYDVDKFIEKFDGGE